MKLLLDTHVLLWWLADEPRLGRQARDLIGDPGNDILVSMVSLWEIAVKTRVGKLTADAVEIAEVIQRGGYVRLDIKPAHLAALSSLPMHHRDPFDHLLIAQAIAEDAAFVSDDRNAHRYPVRLIAGLHGRKPDRPGSP